jgi:hypothetical protein
MNIIFLSDVYKRLRTYVLAIDTEISFLGKVKKENGNLTIEDIRLITQQVSAGNTIMDQDALGIFYDELMEKGEDPSPWKVWIHSHAKMDSFFSTIDNATIESFDLETPNDNWFLSVVTNHAGKTKIRLDIFSPFRYTFNNLEWDIRYDDPALFKEATKEMAEKVTNVEYSYNRNINWREILERMKRRNHPACILLPSETD